MLSTNDVVYEFILRLHFHISCLLNQSGQSMTDAVQMRPSGDNYRFIYKPLGWSIKVTEQMMRDAIPGQEPNSTMKLIIEVFTMPNRPYRVRNMDIFDVVEEYLGYYTGMVPRSASPEYHVLASSPNGVYFASTFDTNFRRDLVS